MLHTPWLFLVSGAHPSCQGGCLQSQFSPFYSYHRELGREHMVSYPWAQRKVVVEPRGHPANVKGYPGQTGSSSGAASGAKLREETASLGAWL